MMVRLSTIAFLGLLGSTPSFARSTAHGRVITEVQDLSSAIENYRADCGVYPDPELWWEELTGMDAALVNIGRSKYTYLTESQDSWGSPYQYFLDRSGKFPMPRIYSFGRDKKSDTAGNDRDDIASWRDFAKVENHYDPPLFTPNRVFIGSALAIGYVGLLLFLHSKRIRPAR